MEKKNALRILFIGDVIAAPGCDYIREHLPALRRERAVDVVIVNGENSAKGNGILPSSAKSLLDSGADVVTTGNHVYKRWEILQYLEETPQVIRPANYPEGAAGNGYYMYDGGGFQLLVLNLMGVSYMEPLDNPFFVADKILNKEKPHFAVVDFHAEASGEKKAMGYYLDGRVSLLVGTHTHVQTADEQILPQGTGYITDAGMTGPIHSVLGIKPENAIEKMKNRVPVRFEVSEGSCRMEGVLAEISRETGLCVSIERIHV